MEKLNKKISSGWKVFDKDLRCRGFQYEIGKTYKYKGEIELCCSGFHFHTKPCDLFNYYAFDSENRVCEIQYNETKTIHKGDKSVTAEITLNRELNYEKTATYACCGKEIHIGEKALIVDGKAICETCMDKAIEEIGRVSEAMNRKEERKIDEISAS